MGANHAPNTNPKIAKSQANCRILIESKYSHIMSHISASFNFLYPRMSKNGVYMVEDLHTAYWDEYEGGLSRAGSFIEQAKRLIDELNADHSRGAVQISEFSRTTMSMHFYDSVVAFERGRHLNKHAPIIGQVI